MSSKTTNKTKTLVYSSAGRKVASVPGESGSCKSGVATLMEMSPAESCSKKEPTSEEVVVKTSSSNMASEFVRTEETYEKKPGDCRWYYAEITGTIIFVAAFICVCCSPPALHLGASSKPLLVHVGLVAWFGVALIVSEILRRLCLLCEEWRHLKTRYDNRKGTLIHLAFKVELPTLTLGLANLFLLFICVVAEPQLAEEIATHISLFFGLVALYVLYGVVARIHHNPVEWDTVMDNKHIGVGRGLAHAYYYGFAKILLPSGPTEKGDVKSFRERAEDFEDFENKTLVSKKLLIIIPDSCYCTSDFQSMDNNIEKLKEGLGAVSVSRAGMKGRPYNSAVYRINDPYKKTQEPIYVSMDMPAILLTLYEMNTIGSNRSSLTESDRLTQAHDFVYVLKNLLDNDLACRDQYELIYYRDRDSQGNSVKLGKVIWDHFKIQNNFLAGQ